MSDKTEEPTPRRLEQARSRGQVVHSFELNAAIGLLAAAFLLQGPGRDLAQAFETILHNSIFLLPSAEASAAWIKDLIVYDLSLLISPVATFVVTMMVVGIGVTLVQIGLKFASERKFFDIERVNPMAGLKRLFSISGIQQLVKAILKLVVVGWVVFSYLRSNIDQILSLGNMDVLSGTEIWIQVAVAMVWRVAGAYLVLAIADYIYLRWEFMRNMRMSKQEIKDELRQSEGDPFIRSRIRQMQRQMMARRMMAMVPKADVIVTNPTHLAIAIQYDAKTMGAPRVLAKGSLLVAQKIVEIAKSKNIPVVQNIPLARAIFHNVELDQEIPPDLYMAMAEILAYVYRLRGNRSYKEPLPQYKTG